VAAASGVAALLALTSAMVAERNDSFCASCHLPPEATFVARSVATAPVDLASAHALLVDADPGDERLRCIDCHGGPGAAGRLRALGLGVRDLASWLGGDFVVVGDEYVPLGAVHQPIADELCAGCHGETLADEDFDNHFHHLLSDPEAPSDLACVDCHDGHAARPGEPYFVTDEAVAPGCDACHAVMGGPTAPLR
jgi:hypothetical protein